VSRNSYQVRAYNLKHRYDVSEFLEAYRRLLQKAVDEIWAEIRWIERYDRKGRKRLIPIIPKDNIFKNHHLRNLLMEGWDYSKLRRLGDQTGILNNKVLEEELR
jgi:putative transposase